MVAVDDDGRRGKAGVAGVAGATHARGAAPRATPPKARRPQSAILLSARLHDALSADGLDAPRLARRRRGSADDRAFAAALAKSYPGGELPPGHPLRERPPPEPRARDTRLKPGTPAWTFGRAGAPRAEHLSTSGGGGGRGGGGGGRGRGDAPVAARSLSARELDAALALLRERAVTGLRFGQPLEPRARFAELLESGALPTRTFGHHEVSVRVGPGPAAFRPPTELRVGEEVLVPSRARERVDDRSAWRGAYGSLGAGPSYVPLDFPHDWLRTPGGRDGPAHSQYGFSLDSRSTVDLEPRDRALRREGYYYVGSGGNYAGRGGR